MYQEEYFKGVGKTENKQYRFPSTKHVLPNLSSQFQIGKINLNLQTKDIVTESDMFIVNPANMWLHDGAGVTGAIFTTMSKDVPAPLKYQFEDDCNDIGFCSPGRVELVLTPQHPHIPGVIHLVGSPIESGRSEIVRRLYIQAIGAALDFALYHSKAIAFPSLGTGVYAIPRLTAAEWFWCALLPFSDHELQVHVDLFDAETYHLYRSLYMDMQAEWLQAGGA